MSVNSFYLHSKQLTVTDYSLSGIAPYYTAGSTSSLIAPQPAISIHVSGNLTGFATRYPTDYITALGCALPSGFTPVSSMTDLISGYCFRNDFSTRLITSDDVTNNKISKNDFTIYQDIREVNYAPRRYSLLSGNAFYDIYAGHVLVSTTDNTPYIAGYGSVVNLSGVLTRAPLPSPQKIAIVMNNYGDSLPDGTALVTFNVEIQQPLNFANTDKFGVGYPGLASSGFAQISCSGTISGVFFPSGFNGTNQSIDIQPQYGVSGTILQWKVPVKCDKNTANGYAGYQIDARYINSSGFLSPPTSFVYSPDNIKALYETKVIPSFKEGAATIVSDNPYQVEVKGVTGRSRISLGIRDIDLISVLYNQKGSYVSSVYTSEKPLYALSLNTNESSSISKNINIWDMVKYYIQFNVSGNGDWIQISPKPRVNEVSTNGQSVPSIIILDSNTFEQDKISSLYNRVRFLALEKEQYNFRIKIEMDTTVTGLQGSWSPQIYDYRVSVIDREAIVGSNFERYLFN